MKASAPMLEMCALFISASWGLALGLVHSMCPQSTCYVNSGRVDAQVDSWSDRKDDVQSGGAAGRCCAQKEVFKQCFKPSQSQRGKKKKQIRRTEDAPLRELIKWCWKRQVRTRCDDEGQWGSPVHLLTRPQREKTPSEATYDSPGDIHKTQRLKKLKEKRLFKQF